MSIAKPFIEELKRETAGSRTILERIPEDKLTWKPHEKSMTLGRLGMHVAELPSWFARVIQTDEYDFAGVIYRPNIPDTRAQIMKELDSSLEKAVGALENATDEKLAANWKLRRGDLIITDAPRAAVLRREIGHLVHHRGQLSVYLRLLGVPLPKLYGPTADER